MPGLLGMTRAESSGNPVREPASDPAASGIFTVIKGN